MFKVIPGVMVKVWSGTAVLLVVLPEASITWGPADAVGILKVRVQDPVAPAVVGAPTGVPSKVTVIPDSLAAKPLPLIVIEVPDGPLVLPNAIVELEITLKVVEA